MWSSALNRANRGEAVLRKPGDFDAFVDAMSALAFRLICLVIA
jgi:hypothetical protein